MPLRRNVSRTIEGEAGDDGVGGEHSFELQMRAGADVLQPVVNDIDHAAAGGPLATWIVRRQPLVLMVVQKIGSPETGVGGLRPIRGTTG